tara:strand:- start:2733 stop:2936 length:204 start_codon:yes stop_codon:yes gene_type:complete
MASYKETLIKTLIWRVIATALTILTGWAVTGNYKFGLAIGGIEVIIKMVGYFLFERVWDKIKVGNKK